MVLAVTSMTAFGAPKEKPTIQPLDPTKTIGEVLQDSPGCHIIVDNGTIYKICPYRVPDTLKYQLQSLHTQQAPHPNK
jgi:hypothetical protein